MTDQQQQHRDEQIAMSNQQAALQSSLRKQEEKIQNPNFLNELRKADLDSELADWIEDEYPSWFAGPRAVSNRGDDWDIQADLLTRNKRERAHAERNPGRLIKHKPHLLAVAQGETDPPGRDPQPRDPLSSDERRIMYGAAEVAADLMALSKDKAGLEAVSTATTESRVQRREDEESSSRLAKVFQ